MTLRSMTGYGRGQSALAGPPVTVEIKTVNHRYLDAAIHLPKTHAALEAPLRKRLMDFFARGHIEMTLAQDVAGAQAALVHANLPRAHEYAEAARQLAQAAGIKGTLKLSALLALPEVMTLMPLAPEAETLLIASLEALEQACAAAVSDRAMEGEQLRLLLSQRVTALEEAVDELFEIAPRQPAQAHEKLVKRLASLPELNADPQRLSQEIALFADRCDISEELGRLKAHCLKMRNLLQSETPVGREMDFLAQEMNREANTICSKSASLAVTDLGLKCKGEADKIREQVQNVE